MLEVLYLFFIFLFVFLLFCHRFTVVVFRNELGAVGFLPIVRGVFGLDRAEKCSLHGLGMHIENKEA